MAGNTKLKLSASVAAAALVLLLIWAVSGSSFRHASALDASGPPLSTSAPVPPNCDPPKLCPVVIDTDQDGYSDYDEDAYGADPNNPASTPESWAFGTCGDGVDNDIDGAADGQDEGCSAPCSAPTPGTYPGRPDYYPYCDKDSDGDGFFDSDELSSGSDPNDPASTPEDWLHATCDDSLDNDQDGAVDAADAGCADVCQPPEPIPLNLPPDSTGGGTVEVTPGGTPIDGGGSAPGQTCNQDVDSDGYSDWDELGAGSDPNVASSTPEAMWYPDTCSDGFDNDLDGNADSADDACAPQCAPAPAPDGQTSEGGATSPSQPCIADSDNDGVDDGTEQILGSDPADVNSTPEHLKFPDTCTDNTDNDKDGQPDASDSGCQSDEDGDGVPDSTDNCPSAWNPDQANSDQDATGDACQDSDGDGFSDSEEVSWGSDADNIASTPEVIWVGDSCNDDVDNDGDDATDSADSGCAYRTPLPPGSGMPNEFIGKDANCDLNITAFDALLILQSFAGLTTVNSESSCATGGATAPGDADCNGQLAVKDSIDVLMYLAGLSPLPGSC